MRFKPREFVYRAHVLPLELNEGHVHLFSYRLVLVKAEMLGLEKGATFPSVLDLPKTEANLGLCKLRKNGDWIVVEARGVCPGTLHSC